MSKLDELAKLTHATKDDLLKTAKEVGKEVGNDPDAPAQEKDGLDEAASLCKSTSKRLLNAPILNHRKRAQKKPRELGS